MEDRIYHLIQRLRALANPYDFNDHTCADLRNAADALERLHKDQIDADQLHHRAWSNQVRAEKAEADVSDYSAAAAYDRKKIEDLEAKLLEVEADLVVKERWGRKLLEERDEALAKRDDAKAREDQALRGLVKVREQLSEARAALEWYADPANWEQECETYGYLDSSMWTNYPSQAQQDEGYIARQALQKAEGEK